MHLARIHINKDSRRLRRAGRLEALANSSPFTFISFPCKLRPLPSLPSILLPDNSTFPSISTWGQVIIYLPSTHTHVHPTGPNVLTSGGVILKNCSPYPPLYVKCWRKNESWRQEAEQLAREENKREDEVERVYRKQIQGSDAVRS